MLSIPSSLYGEYTTLKRFKKLQLEISEILLGLGHVAWAQAIHQKKGTDRQIQKYQEHYIELPDGWHHHQVGYAPTLPQTGITARLTPPEGWHYSSSHRGDVGVWVRDQDQVVFKVMPIITSDGAMNALAYELKHAAMYQGMNSSKVVRLFGLAAYSSPASVTYEKIKLRKHCRVCTDDKYVRRDGQYVRDAYQVRRQYQAELDQGKLLKVLPRYKLTRGLTRSEDLSCLEGVNHEPV